jgi:hypothetical protein
MWTLCRARSASNSRPGATLSALLGLLVSVVGCGPDEDIRPVQPSDPNVSATRGCSLEGVVYALDTGTVLQGRAAQDAGAASDPLPQFSFFVTSQAGLYSLPAGKHAPAPDPALGYGGDFGGLAGADEICTMLAKRSNPGDRKLWRAFLSSPGSDTEARVDAIGRVGPGPWYDFNGLLLARNLTSLLPNAKGRPSGSQAPLGSMFTDENGEDARRPGQDNHDTLTGSDSCGKLYDDGKSGSIASCAGWTSKTLHGKEGNLAGIGGQIPVGHSWPRDFGFGNDPAVGGRWIDDHTISGCEPGFEFHGAAGAPAGDFRVGAGGGYGGFYCFALGAASTSG